MQHTNLLKKCIRSIIMILLVFPAISFSQEKTVTWYADPASIPPDLPITIHHLTAHVDFLPEQNLVKGSAEFTFTPNRMPVDSIVFYTPDFKIKSVEMNNQSVKFHQNGNNLILDVGSNIRFSPDKDLFQESDTAQHGKGSITIVYTATPKAGGIYFIGWRPEEAGKRKQIWAHRPHGWLPYMEGRITMDMFITFDKHYRVFSNGERIEIKENQDGSRTWHYAMKNNHPFFSTALVIGDYEFKTSQTARGVPLEFWYYTGMDDRVPVTYKYTEQMFGFFEKEMGVKYPYPVYREAPVIDYMYGAMETTTSTVFGDYMLIDPSAWWQRNYVNVNAHELAHQWFGNYVSHFVNRDVWLTESFGTYYAKMFEKYIYGEDYYQNIRNDEMFLAFEAAKKNNFPVGGSQGGTQRIYQKGSLVIDMLRDVMGEEGFHQAIKHYLEKYGFKNAETNDFIRCVYESTGKPYNWFFDQWVLRGGEPHYLVSDSVIIDSIGNMGTLVKVSQIQDVNELNGLFKMPITIEVHYKDGTADSRIPWIEKKHHEFVIPNPTKKTVDFVLFDPGRKILKKITYNKTPDQLMAQAVNSKNMIDRYDAWIALRQDTITGKVDALISSFHRETFWLIKSEILGQLLADKSPEVMEIFRQALYDKDANVRKAALKNLNPIPDLLQSAVEGLLCDSSYLNVELALDGLCRSFPSHCEEYLDLTKTMEGWRGKNIRMKWLEIAILSGKKDYLKEVIHYGSPQYEFETRINAFNLLTKLNYSDAETQRYAELAGKHWNNKLSSAAKEYLKQLNRVN